MNTIRSLMTVFLLSVIALSVAGWFSLPYDQPAMQTGGRAVLGISAVAAVVAIVLLWREKPIGNDAGREDS